MERPRKAVAYLDRVTDCEEALECPFNELMDVAWEAGWTPEEAAVAITNLADRYLIKLFANGNSLQFFESAKNGVDQRRR